MNAFTTQQIADVQADDIRSFANKTTAQQNTLFLNAASSSFNKEVAFFGEVKTRYPLFFNHKSFRNRALTTNTPSFVTRLLNSVR